MEHKLLLLVALVAGTQAGPIIDTASRQTCSTQCTGTNKFGYQPGTTYEFDYDVDTATALYGASEGKSGLKMSAKVYMEILSKCEVTIRVGSVTLHERNPESPENFMLSAASREFSRSLEEYPLRVSFQDGRIESICPSDGEKTWVLNIKRGVLSMIQNTMDDLNTDQKVKESDVAGTCDADYPVAENGWYSVTIKKHKNLLGCTQRNNYFSAIQGTSYNVPSEIQSLPIVKSNHECTQVISKSGILQKSTCEEQHTFRPFSRENSGARTESKQSLKYVQERPEISTAKPAGKRTNMNFEHVFDSDKEMKTRKDIERKLVDICQFTKVDVRPETPRLFTDLVHLLRTVGTDTFEEIYQSVQSGSLCSDNNERVRKFFLDAIPMVGTDASLKLMAKLIGNNDITGIEADMWMTTLAFIQHPTKEMIKEVAPLVSKSGKSMLAVTSLLNNYCRTSPCDNDMDVNSLISRLENKIGYGCYVDDNNIDNVVQTLRALGNAGYISSALPTINSCITRKENPMEVRVAAVEAFRRASCETERSEPLTVLKSKDEDSELRIAAYLAVMECPSQTILGDVKTTLENEEVNQVGSFIWSHLTNLMETSNPLKQNIKSILEDELLKKEFDLDKRKFSRNYEGSLFWEKLNTGASVESNVIWSSKSFIPRSAMTNLTVDLFGYSINLLEIGGRVEGLEYFLESYFGPNGYFRESDVKEATKQAVKGIDTKKMNKIDSQFGSEMDKLKGSLYMRVFGNELRYTSFRGLSSLLNEDNFNILDILIGLSKKNDFTFTQNTLFLDSSMIIPTSAGFPLNLTVNGSATIDLKASGKMDLRKLGSSPRSMAIIGEIQPSAAVEISSMMSVDAFVTKSGLKMVSTLHTSTLMKGKVELKDGQIFSAEWDMPNDKMEIVSVKTAFFTVHQHTEKEQKMITENRQTKKACSGAKLAKITGLEICGELQFPNASMKSDAPYFPFTGPVVMDITLQKRDSHKSYNFDAKMIKNRKDIGMSVGFNTPGSKIDRALSADFILKKDEQTFQMGFISPWKKAAVKGAMKNDKALKHVSGDVSVDGKTLYEIVAEIARSRKGNSYIYTQTVLLRAPKNQSIKLKGVAEYQPAKLLDVELTLSGVSKQPIKVGVSYINKKIITSAKASLSLEKKKEYSIETRLQKSETKRAVKYRPYISVKSPVKELFALGGSTELKKGKAFTVDLTVNQITDKPMKLFAKLQDLSFKKSSRYQTKMDLETPAIKSKVRTNIIVRAKSAVIRTKLEYNIPRVSRDTISLNGKIGYPSTKSTKNLKGNMNLALRKRPQYNAGLTFDLSHNKKHSEAEIDFTYGNNKKDTSKRIYLMSVVNRVMQKKQEKYDYNINNKVVYPALGVNFQMKGSHTQTPKALTSDLSMVFGKKQSVSGSLRWKNKSSKLLSMTGDLTISYPGRDIVISNIINQKNAKKYTNTLSVQIEKGKTSVWETVYGNSGVNQYDVSTSLRIPNVTPVVITGQYRPILKNFLASTQLMFGKDKYAVNASSLYKAGQHLQLSSDIEYPARRISAEIEGSIKKPSYSGKCDIKWDVNKDNNKRILLRGDMTLDGVKNFAANMVHSGIFGDVKLRMKHNGGNKYDSHGAVEWGKKNVISLDSSLSIQTGKTSGTITLSSPFKGYKKITVQGSHTADKTQYITNVDLDWKPMKRISTTFNLNRPFSLSNIDATVDVKSPVKGFERSSIRISHKMDNKIETLIKSSWNKNSIQLDIFGVNKGNEKKTDLAGRLNLKSTLNSLNSLYLGARHTGDDRKVDSAINFELNGNAYTYENEMMHYRSGLQVQNSGRILLQCPWRKIESTWTHRNTNAEIISSWKIKSGKESVEFNIDARQSMSLPKGTMSLKMGMKSPFTNLKDVEVSVSHEHRPGFIDSSASLKDEGNTLFALVNNYQRQNGQATFSHVSSLKEKSMSVLTSAKYEDYPLTGKIEITINPETKLSVEGNLDVSSRGLINGDVKLQTPLANFDHMTLSVNQDKEGNELVTRTSLQYPHQQSIVMETRGQWNRKKSLSITVTSPMNKFRKMIAAAEFTGGLRSFHTSGKFQLQPLLNEVSVTAQWSSFDGVIANIRLQTPFKAIPYSQVIINSKTQDDKMVTDVTVEYLPRKEMKFKSSIRPDLENLEGYIKITTPFDYLSYTTASLHHTGTRKQFKTKAELEYEAGKKISGHVSFANNEKTEGSVEFKSPFTNDLKAQFQHTGVMNSFTSQAELQHGSSRKYEINASYGKGAGSLSLRSPGMKDINAGFSHQSNGNSIESHGELQYGLLKKYEMDVKYSKREGSLSLKSPLSEDISAAFYHRGESREFQSHVEFQYGPEKKYELDVLLGKLDGSLLIKSPLLDDISAGFRHSGEMRDFNTHVEAMYGKNKKYEGDLTFQSADSIKASISVKSPISKPFKGGFMYSRNAAQFQSSANGQYGKDHYETSLTFSFKNKVQGSFSLKTPISDDIMVIYSHEGSVRQFKSQFSIQYSTGKKFQLDTTFDSSKKLQGSIFMKTPFTKDVTAAFSHQGDVKKFDTSVELQYSPKKKFQITMNFNSKKKIVLGFALKSPISSDISGSFRHSGDISQFITNAKVYVDKQKKFELDANIINKKRMKGTIKIQSPFTDDITLKVAKKGKPTDFRLDTDLVIGKDKYDSIVIFRLKKDLDMSLSLLTPIKGFKKVKAALTHSGSMKNFKTGGDFSIGKDKVSANLKFSVKPNLAAKLEVETPFKGYKKVTTTVTHEGNLSNFKCHGEILRGKALEFNGDVAFSVSPKLSGSVLIQTPFKGLKNTEATFSHAGSLRNFQSQAKLVYLNNREIDFKAKLNSESDISANVQLLTPFEGFEQFGVVISQTGTLKDFTAQAELSTPKGEKMTANARFSMINILTGEFIITTPIQRMEQTRLSFSHDGTINNFRSHAEILLYQQKSEADVSFSSLSNTEANLAIKTPFFKTLKSSIAYKKQPVTLNAAIEYGKEKIIDTEFKYFKSPALKGMLTIKSSWAKDIYASVVHKGSLWNFKTQSEIAYGKKSIQTENNFNVESDISVMTKIDTPFAGYERIVGSYSHSGGLSDFRCHTEGSLNGQKIEGDITFTSLGPIEGTVAIRTPFEMLREIQSSFRHTGDRNNFNSHAEFSYNGRKTETDISLDTSARINFRALLKDPSMKDIIITFNNDGSLQQFTTHGDLQYSGMKQIEFDVDFKSSRNFVLTSSLRSSCPYLEDIQIDISRKGPRNNIKTLSTISANGKRISGKFDLDSRNGINSQIMLQTPISEDILISLTHNGDYARFQNRAYMQFSGSRQYEIETNWNRHPAKDLSIVLKTPFENYKTLKGTLKHNDDISGIQSGISLQYFKDQAIEFSVNVQKGYETKGSVLLTAPFMPDMKVIFSHQGDMSGAKSKGEFRIDNEEQLAGQIEFTSDPKMIGSIMMRAIDNQFDASYTHEGNLQNFNSHAEMTINGARSAADVAFVNDEKMSGSVKLISPFSNVKDIGGSFSHKYSDGSLTSKARFYTSGKSVSYDVLFNNKNGKDGSVTVLTPLAGFETTSISFKHSVMGSDMTSNVKARYGNDQEIQGDITLSTRSQLSGSATLKTPFSGFEELSASFKHSFRSSRLEHHAEIMYGRQQKIETDIQASFASPYLGSVTLKTPFTDFEESKALVELTTEQFGFQGKVIGSFRQKSIEGSINYNGEGPMKGNVNIKTPFAGYENTVASFTHDVTRYGFQNNVDMTIRQNKIQSIVNYNNDNKLQFSATIKTPFSGLESTETSFIFTPSNNGFQTYADVVYYQDKYAFDISFDSESKLEGAIKVNTPFRNYETTRAAFQHTMTGSTFSSHAETLFKGDKYEGDISFNFQPEVTGTLTIKTPVDKYQYSQAAFRHKMTTSKVESHAEVTFAGGKYEGDIVLSSNPNLEGSIEIKSPFVDYDTKASFSHIMTQSNILSHAELTFMKETSELDISFNNERSMDGSITLKTPFSGYEMTKAAFNNDIRKNNIISHAEITYGQQKKIELDVTGSRGNKLEGSVTLKTPFSGYEMTKAAFNSDVGKYNIFSHAEIEYGQQKKIELDVTGSGGNKLEGSVTLKTPYDGIEMTIYSMKYIPSPSGLKTEANLMYGKNQKMASELTYDWRDNSFDGSINFNTPYNKKISATTSNSLTAQGFTSQSTAKYGKQKVEIDTKLDLSDPVLVSMSFRTPFEGFENTAMTLNAVGDMNNLQAKATLKYSSSQVITAAVNHQMSTQKIESRFTLTTPYIDDISVRFDKNGAWDSFTSSAEASFGQDNSLSQRIALQMSNDIIDFSSVTSATVSGSTRSSTTTFKQENSFNKYKASMSSEYDGEVIFVETELKKTDPFEGTIAIRTPFEYLRDIQGKFTHSGELNQFISSGEFQHERIGKVQANMDFFRSSWRRLNTIFELKTPFPGMEYTKLGVKHTGNKNGIKCSGEAVYGVNEKITGSLKALKNPMEIDIQIVTPFEGFEKLATQAKLSSNDGTYTAEASAAKSTSSIEFKSSVQLNASPMVAEVQLNTPFSGYETSKVIVSLKEDLRDFQSSVDLQLASLPNVNAAAKLQYNAPQDMEGTITFKSEITGAENLILSVINRRNGDETTSRIEGSWSSNDAIVLDSTFGITNSWNSGRVNVIVSTPFENLRSMHIKAGHEYSKLSLKNQLFTNVNGKKWIDFDTSFAATDKYVANIAVREPRPMSLSAEGEMGDYKTSALASINWNTDSDDSQIQLEGSISDNSNSYDSKFDMLMKVSCPTRSYGVKGSMEKSSERFASSMDLLMNDDSVFGYDVENSRIARKNNNKNSHSLKLRFPARSVQVSGSIEEKYGTKTAEGELMWDADRDSSKKIGLRTKFVPQGDAINADVSFEMPSIGQDVKLDSEMTINSGKVLFDGKTEFKYSKDSRKTLVIKSRLEDVAFGSNKNYTFSFDLQHIYSSVDIKMKSHIGQTRDRYSAGVDVDYLSAKKNSQNFALMGEIDNLRKQLNVELRSPVKSLKINGNVKMATPYTLTLQNVYDNEPPMNTELTLDPERRSIDLQMSYDLDNPRNVLHMSAKYINDSAVSAEIYRVENSRRITDSLFAARLNTSRILHSRIHWRPNIIKDLKAVGLRRIAIQSRKFSTGFADIAQSISEELNEKYNLMRQSASEDIRPYVDFIQQICAELNTEINSWKDMSTNMISSCLNRINQYMESLKTVSRKNFPLKDQYDFYVEASKELIDVVEKKTSENYAQLMDLLDEQFRELALTIEKVYKRYQDTVGKITGNSVLEYINTNMNNYQSQLSNINGNEQLSNMANQYTSAIYRARESLNKRMTGPFLGTIKDYGLGAYQMGANAYKFWEVEENIESTLDALYQLVREEIEEEFASIKNTVANLKSTKFTVFDPSNGEIQMDTYLPFAMPSLKVLPSISFNKHYQRMKSYIPNTGRWTSITEYVPTSDVYNWIPPFKALASIEGNHITTFDGKEYDFNGKCGYILARDYVDGNFSVIMSYLGAQKKKLVVMTATQTLQVAPNGKIRIDGKTIGAPYRSKELSVSQEGQLIIIKGSGFQMSYDMPRDSLDLVVSGWYYGKLGGLFGTPNNEIYDDLMTPSRQITGDATTHVNTWEVNSKCQ